MEITEIRIFPKEGQDKKLKAYTTITFDNEFVVRNIKIIEGAKGLFIAMPSRKMKFLCPRCHGKNEVGSKYCNHCGVSVGLEGQQTSGAEAKAEHRDIAHPISQEFREYLQARILEAYEREVAAVGDGAGNTPEQVSSQIN